MALRIVTPARASRMARSIGRNPSFGSGAGDPERLRRGATRYRAVEQDQRSHRAARTLRAAPDRQFRVTATIEPSSEFGTRLQPPHGGRGHPDAGFLLIPYRALTESLVCVRKTFCSAEAPGGPDEFQQCRPVDDTGSYPRPGRGQFAGRKDPD